jgi:hypothetical protein
MQETSDVTMLKGVIGGLAGVIGILHAISHLDR